MKRMLRRKLRRERVQMGVRIKRKRRLRGVRSSMMKTSAYQRPGKRRNLCRS